MVTATITNSLGETVTTTSTILVKISRPKLMDFPSLTPINENQTATLTGTYSDPGSAERHELDIDWDGDGTFDQTVAVTGGTFTVTHQFLDDNPTGTASDPVPVTVRLRDDRRGPVHAFRLCGN